MENNYKNFSSYINNKLSKESIMIIYDVNNIIFEKCELFSDFIQSLFYLVFDTYMGDDFTNYDDQIKHYNWCWNKNKENFEEEGFIFDSPKLFNYLLSYLTEVFYLAEKDDNFIYIDNILFWIDVFDYTKLKTEFELDTFIEAYKLMDSSLKNRI